MFRILGPLEVAGADPLGGARPRTLLRTLLLNANAVVPAEKLIDAVWGVHPPATARHALQVYVSQLRKAIPDGERHILTEPTGYRIRVAEDQLDALAFEARLKRGQELLAAGEPAAAADELASALALWRGDIDAADADPGLARLEELRLVASEHRIAAEVALGGHAEAVPELERLVARHPLRERLREQLMLALYRSGRQADALALYADTRRMLVGELGLEPSAGLRELEAAILRQDPSLAPSARRETATALHVPAAATPLIGRRREIDEIRALLAREARLVTVAGPGGAGKTRVAAQLARELAAEFRDGAVFVGLAALRDPRLVAPEIARALGVEPGTRATELALAEHLAPRELLLVVDNFEQVDDAAPQLSQLLTAAPELKILVTSRRPLRLYGEHEFSLPPLRLREEAMPLFAARAKAAGAPAHPADEIARLCEALDCLPLAIELVAARARRASPEEMLARFTSRLELASLGPRDAPERHRTLGATIAWSYELLDDRQRRIFEAASVFAGGWDTDAADAVTGAQETDLGALTEQSLIQAGADRYSMLETIREYAQGRLRADAARDSAVRGAHARHYATLAELAERQFREGRDQSTWLARLDREHDNLRAALAWLELEDPVAELRLAGLLSPFWAVRGHAAEGLERLKAVLDRALPCEAAPHADALAGACVMSWILGDYGGARAYGTRALAIYRALDDASGMVRALAHLGYVSQQTGDLDEATSSYEECLAIARSSGSTRNMTIALNCLTELALASRDLRRAREVGEEGLAIARATEDHESIAVAVLNLGYVALHEERLEEARTLLGDAAELFDSMGDLEVTAHALTGLAAALAEQPEAAARLLGSAAALRDRVGGTHDFEPDVRERVLADVRTRLGQDRFAEEFGRGRLLSAEEVLGLSAL